MTATVIKLGLFGVGGVFLLTACSGPAPVQAAPPVADVAVAAPATAKPEVSINEVMVALIDHAGHNLWDVEKKGQAPKSDADWQNVWEHAVQIAAAGPAITVGGTGSSDQAWVKSPAWHTYAQQMSDGAIGARNAAKSKDFDALVKANGQLVESCESCHKAFKPALPTEGVVHAHVH
ncbi:MAG: cytochrome c [Acidobacteriota bacterium]